MFTGRRCSKLGARRRTRIDATRRGCAPSTTVARSSPNTKVRRTLPPASTSGSHRLRVVPHLVERDRRRASNHSGSSSSDGRGLAGPLAAHEHARFLAPRLAVREVVAEQRPAARGRGRAHDDARLLEDLAHRGIRRRLARLELAAESDEVAHAQTVLLAPEQHLGAPRRARAGGSRRRPAAAASRFPGSSTDQPKRILASS